MSEIVQVKLENLALLDHGKVAAAFQKHLDRLVQDMRDRPQDKTARSLTLAFTFVPVMDEARELESVVAEVEFKSKVPVMRTNPLSFGVKRGGQLFFAPDAPDNSAQRTFTPEPGDDD